MPNFNYRARNNTGKLVKGTIEAKERAEVAEKLKRMGYSPVDIIECKGGISLEEVSKGLRRVSTQEMVMFNIQLANMLSSGLSIMSSLDTLQKQIENKRFKEILGTVSRNIEGGMSFSQALTQHPRIFSRLFVSMVSAGEASGNLEQVLNRYAVFAEAQEELRQQIQGALFYPAILVVAAMMVVLFIVTFVIPKFVEIFNRAGVTLPVPTVMLYNFGIGVRKYWYVIIIVGALIVGLVRTYLRTKSGRLRFDRTVLKIPVIGSLIRKTAISRFARTLATLVGSGVPILQSLDIVRNVVGNEILGQVVYQMRVAVEKGEKLASSLKVSGEFPDDTIQMISVGEETGSLDEMLNKISDFYDRAIGYNIKKLTMLIEPLFLVVIGVIVAFIMASMLLPMFDMVKVLRR